MDKENVVMQPSGAQIHLRNFYRRDASTRNTRHWVITIFYITRRHV